MGTSYSGWSDTWRPSGSSVDKQYRARLDTSYGYNATQCWVTATVYVNINSSVEAYYWGRLSASSQSTYTSAKVTTTFKKSGAVLTVKAISTTYYWNRTHSSYTVGVTGGVMSDKKSWDGYWMNTTQYFTIPAKDSHVISYNANDGTGSAPAQTKWYGEDIYLNDGSGFSKGEGWEFAHWNTDPSDTGTTYEKGQKYTVNGNSSYNKTLYAIYSATNPPEFDFGSVIDDSDFTTYTKNFSEIKVTVSNIRPFEEDERYIAQIILSWGEDSTTLTYTRDNQPTGDVEITLTPTSSGTNQLILTIIDNAGAVSKRVVMEELTIVAPTWTYTATFDAETNPEPNSNPFGYADVTVKAKNQGTDAWETIVGNYVTRYDAENNKWLVDVILTEAYVDDPTELTPNAEIKATYIRQDTNEKEYRTQFFSTTRNANFSTGISNTMFISGCESANYSSRVWWSEINNPLYFPDLNYVEVGSNDTNVMGLCKVGDYLGVVKQSKTTDTAIFLVYPTSFEDDTTYAVKQLSSGIGAYGKYTFNVLGDETLFLSPNGVMAIVPSEDRDHKVQNRSFFIDGKLLKESGLDDAYSFVFDGKYYLAVNDVIYVLDGNQRNSWGNDRTNLVYECYYLDNVSATCLMKYNDELYFSNNEQLCRFKSKEQGDAYYDSTGEGSTPVAAHWSTIVDDDGALNYYKTMQKKGNVISVFPNLPFKYVPTEVTEAEFNKNKKNYFILDGEDYVRCNSESVYNEETTYYIRVKTATKVYVRKDMNEPVEIQRQFGESTEIPSELFVNKKFKKYKRLQFIVENNEAEPFGVDSIIKQYTVGNYAKR